MPFLVNGRPLKAINQWYNKRRARLQAKLPEGVFVSRQLDILADKRARQITDYLHVASRRIVDWLVAQRSRHAGHWQERRLETSDWPGEANQSERSSSCRMRASSRCCSYKAELVGIQVIVSEESYTSKCSFLDLEPIGKHEV